jgi:pimeloyl-ACP methyl ester carboxylesterase
MRAGSPAPTLVAMTLVTSTDGTRIAVHVSGAGRPLVVVPGTSSDHTSWRLALPFLEPHVAVHLMDRRGRGASGDGRGYAIEQEYADVAAVVDAAGSGVDVLGHSYGGNLAFGAALMTGNIRRMVLYEGWPVPDLAHRTAPPQLLSRLETLLARGDADSMLETFYRDMVRMTPEEIRGLRATPSWPSRVAAAHTVPRELRAFGAQPFDPVRAALIDVPVLLLVGADSPAEIQADPLRVAAALPDAWIRVLPGQAHIAHLTDPGVLARAVLSFLRD